MSHNQSPHLLIVENRTVTAPLITQRSLYPNLRRRPLPLLYPALNRFWDHTNSPSYIPACPELRVTRSMGTRNLASRYT